MECKHIIKINDKIYSTLGESKNGGISCRECGYTVEGVLYLNASEEKEILMSICTHKHPKKRSTLLLDIDGRCTACKLTLQEHKDLVDKLTKQNKCNHNNIDGTEAWHNDICHLCGISRRKYIYNEFSEQISVSIKEIS